MPGILSQADAVVTVVFMVVALFVLGFIAMVASLLAPWLQAVLSGVPLSFIQIIGMRIRRVDPKVVVPALIRAHRAGVDVSVAQLETHYLAGGRVGKVVGALIAAKRGNVPLTWEEACAIDLSGHDVLQDVQTAADPRAQSSNQG